MDKFFSNDGVNNSIIQAFDSLKQNIMSTLMVCEIARIQMINEEEYVCEILNEETTISCIACRGLDLKKDDIVVVIFNNTEYRPNLIKVKNNRKIQKASRTNNLHKREFGIILNVIYREGE